MNSMHGPVVHRSEETKFNGMINVPWIVIEYKGFKIQPKLDMGSSPWLSHGNSYRAGWVVVDEQGCNALPGATWCHSMMEAEKCIDLWVLSQFNGPKFWELMAPYRY